MATDLERLVVQLSADIKRYETALNRAGSVANQRTRAIEQRFSKMQTAINASFSGIALGATKAFAIIGGAKGLQNLVDTSTRIDNALKVAGLSGEELERVYGSLRDAAVKNAAPLESLVDLYGRVALVQGELGKSSNDVVKFSENIALALRVGGKSAQESAGAITQLGQALGSGTVRAEEFSSIVEGAPVILQAAAKGIKEAEGSVAKLRKIMLDGNLSSKALFDGFQIGAASLEGRVSGSVLTLGQSFTNLYTSLLDVTREFNTSTGAGKNAAESIGSLAAAIASVDVSGFISQIREANASLAELLGNAGNAEVFQELNKLLGITNADGAVINPDLTAANDKITAFEKEIKDLQAAIENNSRLGFDNTEALARLNEVKQALAETQALAAGMDSTVKGFTIGANGIEAIPNRPQQGPAYPTAEQKRQLAASQETALEPISIKDPQYKTEATEKAKKARKERLDDYAQEVKRIRERTEALQTETEVQSKLDPLVNDYGEALAFARAQQDLTNAAIEAGKQITPELAAEIDNLARAYANSTVAAGQLEESQEKIKDRQQELLSLQKDVTRGLVDDLIEGKSAAEAFAGALKKIASALLDQAFNSLFSPQSSGGIGGFGGLFKLLGFASGGFTGAGGKYEPAGVVHKGEYVIPKDVVDKVGVKNIERAFGGYANGGLVNSGLSRSVSASNVPSYQGGVSAVYSPNIDARGASVEAVARLERIIETDRRNFAARVENAVTKAQKSNRKGF